jgi:hypothetical protein
MRARFERVTRGACPEHLHPGLRITRSVGPMGYGDHQQAD